MITVEFKRDISGDTDPEIIQQSYYQLAQVYCRTHKTAEAQAALASLLTVPTSFSA